MTPEQLAQYPYHYLFSYRVLDVHMPMAGNTEKRSDTLDITTEDLAEFRKEVLRDNGLADQPWAKVIIENIIRLNPSVESRSPWADAVANLCAINHCGFHLGDPDKTLAGLIDIEIQMAQDPAINQYDRRWQLIPETGAMPVGDLLVYCPDLVDEDFNPSGTVEAFWQEGPWFDQSIDAQPEDHPGNWIGAVWNNDQDCYSTRVVKPTHWMTKPRPAKP